MKPVQRTLPVCGLTLVIRPCSETDQGDRRDRFVMTDGTGKDVSIAQLRALQQQLELALGGGPGLRTVADLCEWYVKTHVGPPQAKSTIQQYTRHASAIAEKFGSVLVTEVSERHAREIFEAYEDREQEAHFLVRSFRRMLTMARVSGLATGADPFARIKHHPNRRTTFLAIEQLQQMWGELGEMREGGTLWRPAVDCLRLLVVAPFRQGEARTLERAWVHARWRSAHLPRSKTGPRVVKLNTQAMQVIEEADGRGRYVFTQRSSEAKPVPYTCLRDVWVELCRRMNLIGLTLHCLRHTAGTQMARNGASVPTLQDVLGHKSPGMSMSYCHAASSDVDDALERYGQLVVGKVGNDD